MIWGSSTSPALYVLGRGGSCRLGGRHRGLRLLTLGGGGGGLRDVSVKFHVRIRPPVVAVVGMAAEASVAAATEETNKQTPQAFE